MSACVICAPIQVLIKMKMKTMKKKYYITAWFLFAVILSGTGRGKAGESYKNRIIQCTRMVS